VLILAINCGSSSLKAALVDTRAERRRCSMLVDRLDSSEATLRIDDGAPVVLPGAGIAGALAAVVTTLAERALAPEAIVHRVAHGGGRYTRPTPIDEDVIATLESLAPLAPLHNPPAVAGIRVASERWPGVPQVAVFDTAFHATLPRRAREYALPRSLTTRHGLRRHGFHGTSHAFVARQAAQYLRRSLADLRIVTCHLGNGCSLAAVEFGRSVETSMGLTPLEGVPMGTRPGDLDAGLLLALMRAEDLGIDDTLRLLTHESGLKGLAGIADMREIESRAAAGDDAARLALAVFTHRVRKYIGAYVAVMGGVDAIVFTGGIGENSALVRHRVAQRLDFLGAPLDEDANRDARVGHEHRVVDIAEPQAPVRLLVVATDEELQMAGEAAALLTGPAVPAARRIPIAISARHVHLTPATIEALFGPGHPLTVDHAISQPGQYAACERLSLIGPRGRIDGVRVLGPPRRADQVEISRTDEFLLGIDAPVRESGDLRGTPGIRLEGPAGAVTLKQGVICALRHIHMSPADADAFGVADRDTVDVRVDSDGRSLVFGDVLVRVSPDFVLEMHVDTDEGNAAGLERRSEGVLAGTGGEAAVLRRSPGLAR